VADRLQLALPLADHVAHLDEAIDHRVHRGRPRLVLEEEPGAELVVDGLPQWARPAWYDQVFSKLTLLLNVSNTDPKASRSAAAGHA
jgi:hypothetical protein